MVRSQDLDAGALDGVVQLERLRHLFDELPALIAYWDKDLCNQVANAAYLEYFGFTPEQVRGMHISDVLGPAVYASNLPYLTAALAGEEQLFERTLVDTLGRVRHTQASYLPDQQGDEVRGIFVLVTDVTPRVEAQRNLDEAQELADVGSWFARPDDGVVTWSRQMYRIVGQDPATFVPSRESYNAFLHPDDRDRVVRTQDEKLWSGEDFDLRYRLVVDGEVRHVASRIRPVLDATGEPVLLRGTVQDDTSAQQQAASLESANALLINMLAMVGHDVRQPVGVILGNLEQALDTWPGDEHAEHRVLVERAYVNSRRLGELVQDILTMVNVDMGVLALRRAEVDLAALSTEVAGEFGTSEIHVVVHGPARASADPFHLRQALTNLVANAERYGAAPLGIEVACSEGQATVTVTDRGEGVPAPFVPHLFERFTRARTGVAVGTPGSGFGLFIARELAEANGGTVTYAPNLPTGARFTLSLPAID